MLTNMSESHILRETQLSEFVHSSSNTQDCAPCDQEDERLECQTGDARKCEGRIENPIMIPSPVYQGREDNLDVCRVCQCAEADRNGEAALKFLGISHPLHCNGTQFAKDRTHDEELDLHADSSSKCVHCSNQSDLETGSCSCRTDSLIKLGCACKNDLALAHYACALRWFVSKGSTVCEICGKPAVNISLADQNKVIAAFNERDVATNPGGIHTLQSHDSSIDVAPRAHDISRSREQLLEAVSWFDPHGNAASSLRVNDAEQTINVPDEELLASVSPATKCAVEGTGILIATGLLTVTIMWLLAPRVGKGVAKKVLNILLGGLCALCIVVFLRFGVLPRIKYGPARYWAILLVFWFLVFGVWASSTRNARSSG